MKRNRIVLMRGPLQQRGAALVVGLILLVVVTLVGVGAMQSTTLQEKMAGNLRDSNLSFQAAETALRLCENSLQIDYTNQVASLVAGTISAPPVAPLLDQTTGIANNLWIWSLDENQIGFPVGTRLDPNPNPGTTPPWWAEPTNDSAWWASAASNSQTLPANTLDGLSANPGCIMEGYIYAPANATAPATALRRNRAADGIVVRNEASFRRERNYYRITARGVGGSNTAVNLLQTGIYRLYYVPNT
ncbi:MAG: PilX N-terminal domain-containing pilus assembly protein [Candidatus Competibacter sp.]